MKKFIVLLAVVASVASAFAGQFSASASAAPYWWDEVASKTTLDSVVGVDSSFLFTKVSLQRGCGYAVRTTDSVNVDTIQLVCRVYDGNDVVVAEVPFDTIVSGGTGNQYQLSSVPIGYSVIGQKFSIIAKSWISAKVAKIRRAHLWRYRTVETDLPWNVEP